jgi:hypothetical protein
MESCFDLNICLRCRCRNHRFPPEKWLACIGALRADRAAFPWGLKISAGEFAKTPGISDFSLAEAKESEYCVYRYEGKLNGIESAAAL